MTFLDAGNLWLLAVVAVIALAYVVAQWRRRRDVVTFTNVEALAAIAPRHPGWRRHLAAATFLLMGAALVVAIAKPAERALVPDQRATIVVAIDTSRSMQATDVAPRRLAVAQREARRFVRNLPSRVRVGFVAFSGTARLMVPPTLNRSTVLSSIGRVTTSDGTAVGEAIHAGLDAIRTTTPEGPGASVERPRSERRSAIVILSDGETTTGRPAVEAARVAKDARVRITTIAVGTPGGTLRLGADVYEVPVHRRELEALAELTNGRHYDVTTGAQLAQAYREFGDAITHRPGTREVTGWFVLGALVAGLVAAGATLRWTTRIP